MPRTEKLYGSSSWIRGWQAWALLSVLSLLPYLPSLRNGFAFDDQSLIQDNSSVLSSSPADAWTRPFWPDRPACGLYRPVTTFSFWLNARVFGMGAGAFHAFNLLLHMATTLVVWRLLRRLFPAWPGRSLCAAALAAIHPLRSEAVVWAVGRSELLAAFWGLLAYLQAVIYCEKQDDHLTATKPPAWILPASGVTFGLAMLSKESAAGLCLLPVLHYFLWGRRKAWRSVFLVWLPPVALMLFLRVLIFGSALAIGQINRVDNILAHMPVWNRMLGALGFQWSLIGQVLLPVRLTPDYSFSQLVPTPAWQIAGAALLVLGATVVVHAARARDWARLWGICFVTFTGLLTSNVLFPIGTVLAERLAYLPSVGAFWLLVDSADRLRLWLRNRLPGAGWLFLVVALSWGVGLGVRAWIRTLDWRDNGTLFRAAAKTSPRSVRVLVARARVYAAAGDLEAAVGEGEKALAQVPDFSPAVEVTTFCLRALGRPQEGCDLAEPIVRAGTGDPLLLCELAYTYLALNRGADADAVFRQASHVLPPGDPRPITGHASALALQSKWIEAEQAWKAAVALTPEDFFTRRNWAYALWQTGAVDSAEAVYRGVLDEIPDDPSGLNDLAWFLAGSSRNPDEAVALARRAFRARPDRDSADTLLEALLRLRGCAAARAWVDSVASDPNPDLHAQILKKLEERCGSTSTGPDRGLGLAGSAGRR